MKLIEYAPDRFDLVRQAASRIKGNYSLHHRPFVDYYYASRGDCKLYLALSSEGEVAGLVGVEKIPFEVDSHPVTMTFASNFHSFQHGVGGLLFLQWMKSCDLALEYGGTADAHRVIRSRQWTYFPGIRIYVMNDDFPVYPSNPFHVRAAKWLLRQSARRQIPRDASRVSERSRRISIREEFTYSSDLLPGKSPFAFRLAPTVEYLSWRYNLRLSFVRYRLFRILEGGRSAGYVIINEGKRRLHVAQCDAEDAETLACGVAHSLVAVGEKGDFARPVQLTCSNPSMGGIYEKFGFKRGKSDYPLAIWRARGQVEIPAETARWLVNFDWGDLGLLGPFLDQESGPFGLA